MKPNPQHQPVRLTHLGGRGGGKKAIEEEIVGRREGRGHRLTETTSKKQM